MSIIYCQMWSDIRNKPLNLMSSEEANKNHIKKIPYTAIIKENNKIINVIEFTNSSISVSFKNKFSTSFLFYLFKIRENNSIFLTSSYYYYYDEFTNEKLGHLFFNFKEDGYIFMEKRDYNTGKVEEKELITEPLANWGKYPDFGNYEDILKFER